MHVPSEYAMAARKCETCLRSSDKVQGSGEGSCRVGIEGPRIVRMFNVQFNVLNIIFTIITVIIRQ